ncbi:MAG: four-carbon acid sugar kinase family protein [Tepidisphaeraceae bacterium]
MTADGNNFLLSFFGDDFTGSTDAMESLARSGVRTVLFTASPTPRQLAQHGGVRAFGVAGMTRSMPPDAMEGTLRPAFVAMGALKPPIVHYKVCSTFDSSPTVGSVGRAIDVGADVFGSKFVPVVAGAPALGRHCVFGNLFARSGPETEPFRLDRHPSMSKHPTTPMDEADLRRHLAKQTDKPIALLDVLAIDGPDPEQALDRLLRNGAPIVLIDLLHDGQLATVGRLIDHHGQSDAPHYVVGSSGVESALAAHWRVTGAIPKHHEFAPAGPNGPIVAICGSCSPVTAGQIRHALASGFDEAANLSEATDLTIRSLRGGRSVVIHTGMGETDKRLSGPSADEIGPALGTILRDVLDATKVRRVIVAGGDTSGHVATALGIESMEMIAELARGSPLCRVRAPNSPAGGIECTFKGGQIGKVGFFTQVQQGIRDV